MDPGQASPSTKAAAADLSHTTVIAGLNGASYVVTDSCCCDYCYQWRRLRAMKATTGNLREPDGEDQA